MTASVRNWRCWSVGSAVALLLLTATVLAEPGKSGDSSSNAPGVDMFGAIERGDIAVQLIFKDSTQCRVRIENKTDKPLSVKLPDAFAGVPVLAQRAGASATGRSSGTSNKSGGGQQSMGGGMGGGGMMGGGMGMFNVAPEKVGQLDVPVVCLEHGKHDPRPNIPYEIKPIDSVSTKAGVRELCEMLSTGKVDQRAAQAAAWHLNNNMTWEELAAKRLKHANGTSEPYFSRAEIQAGIQVATTAVKAAAERQKQSTGTGTSQSASQ